MEDDPHEFCPRHWFNWPLCERSVCWCGHFCTEHKSTGCSVIGCSCIQFNDTVPPWDDTAKGAGPR